MIRDNQVIIPSMDIESNAINMAASGSHGFDNLFDYRLRLKLSDLLYNKSRQAQQGEFQVAADDSDTRTLFLKVYNDGSGTEVEMDREKTAQKIREDMKQEKEALKQVLHDELGLFKKDAAKRDSSEHGEDRSELFKFEFTDEPEKESNNGSSEDRKRWWRRNRESDTVENKPAMEFVIDE
jgi:hypothetical protein